MGERKKVIAMALSFVACALLSAFVGAGFGFMEGVVYGYGSNGVRVLELVQTLRDLRAGRTAPAIERLEGALDTAIIENWGTRHSGPPASAWLYLAHGYGPGAPERKFYGIVAGYRDEHPTKTPVPQVRDAIAEHLKEFKREGK